jgi:predicted component of viral defense system (DUF524 family)
MTAVDEVLLPVFARNGHPNVHLRIALLPTTHSASGDALRFVQFGETSDDLTPAVQLLEGCEYVFEWQDLPAGHSQILSEPREVFQPDSPDGTRGRLRPNLFTGTMAISLLLGGEVFGRAEVEVRSRKLAYLSEYRWMLRDIAEHVTELVMDRFGASETSFAPDESHDAMTLYQRFAFIRALITSEPFQLALNEITRRPHTSWEEKSEMVMPGQPFKANSRVVRQFSSPGPRTAWPSGLVETIPVRLERHRTEATHDTTPNRFVRFALERWRQVLADIDRGLARDSTNPAVSRGRREVAQVLDLLEEYLRHDLFRDLSPLHRFPADDQALQRREGYREVFRAYHEFELAARLSWRGFDSSYSAGQCDVATLYEYWAFLQLSKVVAGLVGETFDMRPLVETRAYQLNVVLQSGHETVLTGVVNRLGRKLTVELCFNRTFRGCTKGWGSWSRSMRPDYSILISAAPGELATFEPVVLHFDAKYRVDFLKDLFGDGNQIVNKEGTPGGDDAVRGAALRSDLLKMHAYRDAIRRSVGAYVLYPGDELSAAESQFLEHQELLPYQELLPGLGAFALLPSNDGDARGIGTVREFLDHVLDHVATRLTRHERGRFWIEEAYGAYDVTKSTSPGTAVDPGSNSAVLLGFVKDAEHWDWIHRSKTYNVRAEGRPGGLQANSQLLYSQLLLLYCPETNDVELVRILSEPELVHESAMAATGYRSPKGSYLCVQLGWLSNQLSTSRIQARAVDDLVRRTSLLRGAPIAVSWGELKALGHSPPSNA